MQAPAGRWQCRAWLFEYSVGAQDESYRPVEFLLYPVPVTAVL